MSLLFDGTDDKLVTPSLTFDTIVFDVKLTEFDLFSTGQDGGIYKESGVLRLNVDWQHWEASTDGTSYSSAQYYPSSNNRTTLYFRKPNSATVTGQVNLFHDGEQYFGEGELFSVRFLLAGNTQAFYDMSTGTVLDQSGNGKHATLTGGTWTVTPGGPSGPEPIRHTLSFSESVNLSETFTKRASRFKTLTDSIVATDTIAKGLSVLVADSVAMTENENENTSKLVNDALSVADAQTKAAMKVIADNINFDESLSERIERNLSDFIPIDDNISLSNSNTRTINLADSIAILDSISKSLTRSIADNVDLSDKDDETVLKSLVDSVTLSDSLSTYGGKTILLTDSITVTDSINTTKQLSRYFNESVVLSDAFTKQSAQSIKLYDVIVSADNIDIYNPDAPELIGIIHLQGKRELFVYLEGKRDLTVNLQGKRELTIHLKGGLNMISNQDFSMISGDTKTVVIELDEVADLTGASAKWGMKRKGSEEFTIFKESPVLQIVNKEIHIPFEKADTEELSGKFIHECEITDQLGNVSTVTTGTVIITTGMIK